MIIYRYLSREVFSVLTAITVGLMLIFISNQLIRFLGLSANGKLAGDVILTLVALQTPILLALLLPLGLYLGILIAYGRLYADSEMSVLSGCGVSQGQLLQMSLKMASLIAMIVGFFMLWVNPTIMSYRDQIMITAGKKAILRTIMPGRFREAPGGQAVFYIKGLSRDRNEAEDVFMVRQKMTDKKKQAQWELLTAESATQTTDPKTGENFIVIKKGHQYIGNPGDPDFRIIEFNDYKLRLKKQEQVTKRDSNAMSMLELFKASPNNLEAQAEIQWRLSLPLSVFLLTLLAIPLSQVKPRQGKFAKLVPAVLLYVLYANMMFVGRAWIEDGKIPVWLGVWWIHFAVLVIIFFIWGSHTRWWSGFWRK